MWKKAIWGACVVALAGTAARLELRNCVPWNSVLQINLNGAMEGQRGVAGASAIPLTSESDVITEPELERAIDAARDDRRVGGMVLRIGDANGGGGRFTEIAAHIDAFRKAGKATVCFLGDEDDSDGNSIASACDKRISESVSMDEDMVEFFDGAFGEDNWSPIDVRDYLKRVRHGD